MFGQLEAASGVSGPVKVESAMLFQSTWNLYTVSAFTKSSVERKRFGLPAGGVPVCRRALLGRMVKSPPPTSNETIFTVGLPAYICALLKANTRTPLKVEPAPKANRFADM